MVNPRDIYHFYRPWIIPQDWASDFYNVSMDRIDPLNLNANATSLFVLSYDDKVRRYFTQAAHHRWFKGTMLFVILLNAVTLALRDPQLQGSDRLQSILDITDIIFISLFALEMFMKIVAYGVILHQKSYLRHPWNILDAVVVISGIASLFVSGGSGVTALRVIRVFRPLRAFAYVKSLRHILGRIVRAVPRMTDVFMLLLFIIWVFDIIGVHLFMGALNGRCVANVSSFVNWNSSSDSTITVNYTTAPEDIDLTLTSLLNGSNGDVFALIMNDTNVCGYIFPGSGRLCSFDTNGVTLPQTCLSVDSALVDDKHYIYNYNNAFSNFLLVFKIMSRDNWPDDYNDLGNAIGLSSFAYVLVITLLAGYLCVNLFIAVFEAVFTARDTDDEIDARRANVKFTTMLGARTIDRATVFCGYWKGRSEGERVTRTISDSALDTSEGALFGAFFDDDGYQQGPDDGTNSQHEPAQSDVVVQGGPKTLQERFSYFLRKKGWSPAARIATSVPYNVVLLLVVVFNAIVLAMDRVGTSKSMDDFINWATFAFTILFLLDAVVKIIGFGPSYFRSPMNLADFVLCGVSIPDIIALNNSAFAALRAFRLVRLLRIAHRWRELQRLLKLLVKSVRSVTSLSVVAFIIMYIYAILGFQLFGKDVENQRMSFATVFDSLLTVFICVTGENQDNVANAVAKEFGWYSVFYFITLTVFGNFILTNVFIAIILENFSSNDNQLIEVEETLSPAAVAIAANSDGNTEVQALQPRFIQAEDPQLRTRGRVVLLPDNSAVPTVKPPRDFEFDSDGDDGNAGGDVTNTGSNNEDTASAEVQRLQSFAFSGNDSTILTRAEEVGATIQDAVGVDGMSQVFAEFAAHEGMKRSCLVGDAVILSAQAERRVAEVTTRAETAVKRPAHALMGVVQNVVRLQRERKRLVRIGAPKNPISSPSTTMTLDNFSTKFSKFKTIAERESQLSKWEGLLHHSFCVPSTNLLRRGIGRILKHPATEWVMVLVTLASSVFLALDNRDLADRYASLIRTTDIVFCAIFVFEAVLKIFALGAVRHPGSYFRSLWNIVDLLVAVFACAALFDDNFKLFRAFRVLRLLNLSFTLRVITSSIIAAIPGMSSVLVFVGLLFLTYAVLGVGLFKGLLYNCNDPTVFSASQCTGDFTQSTAGAFSYVNVTTARLWSPATEGCTYDNVEGALYCLFMLVNQDAWFSQMYSAVDYRSKQNEISRNANPFVSLYFISFMIVGQFFAVNLFVGVLVDRFVQQRKKGEGHSLLTPSQQQWILVQKVLFRAEVRGDPPRPTHWLRSYVFSLCTHWLFDYIFFSLIVLNSAFLSAYYFGMSSQLRLIFDDISTALIAVFTLEIVLKCTAFAPARFLSSPWNRLDVVVVAFSWVGLGVGNNAAVVRIFRVSRLLLLLRKMKGLQTLFVTLYHAIPEFLNVSLVLLVMYFIFAAIGVQLFDSIDNVGIINDNINFHNIGMAFISLYIMMTQESWGDIANAIASQSRAGYPYAILFMISVSWILINLLVTVVVDVFGEAEETERQDSSLTVIDVFRQRWCEHDLNGTKMLPYKVVVKILPTMPSSIWDRSTVSAFGARRETPWICVLRQLKRLHIPMDSHKKVRYEDCVASIALRLFSISVSEAIRVSQSTVYGVSWKATHFSIHHEYAATLLTRAYRRHLATKRERQLEMQLRLLKDQHSAVVEAELEPLRRSHQEAIRLVQWLSDRLKHSTIAPPDSMGLAVRRENTVDESRCDREEFGEWVSGSRVLLEDDDCSDIEVVFPPHDLDDN